MLTDAGRLHGGWEGFGDSAAGGTAEDRRSEHDIAEEDVALCLRTGTGAGKERLPSNTKQ